MEHILVTKKWLYKWFLMIEFCVIVVILFAFWHHTPPYREAWVWLIYLSIPFIGVRIWLYHKIIPYTPLNILLPIFVLLTILNFRFAPYQRADLLVLICRPLVGIWLFANLITQAEVQRKLDTIVILTFGMITTLITFALTATQWVTKWDSKFYGLYDLAQYLPKVDWSSFPLFQNALLSFNPNEMGGALSWVCTLLAGIALSGVTNENPAKNTSHLWRIFRVVAGILFCFAIVALVLGQSRSAILGVLVGLFCLSMLLITHRWLRRAIIGVVVAGVLIIGIMILNPLGVDEQNPEGGTPFRITVRDLNTTLSRRFIWMTAIEMVGDYPMTGVGMSMFRTVTWYNQDYELDEFKDKGYPAPHAHNEWLQIGADFGLPGLILYLVWYGAILKMLWIGYRYGNRQEYIIAISVLTALISHNVYGMLDAITLWDRYQFLFWWIIGLGAAQYVLVSQRDLSNTTEATEENATV